MAGVFRGRLALGTKLSGEGAGARLTFALGALITVGFAVFAARVARRDGAASLADAVALSSTALAWVAGLLFLLGAAARGLSGDRSGGVPALYRLHGVTRGEYLLVRTLGLGLHLVRMVATGSLVVAIAGAAAAPRAALVLAAARGWASCLVYALAFALVTAPLTIAASALGAASAAGSSGALRTAPGRPPRRGFWLVVLLFLVPAIASRATVGVIDPSWRGVFGVPAALSAVRSLVLGGGGGDRENLVRALHAAVVLLVMAALGALLLRAAIGSRRLRGGRGSEEAAW